MAVTIALNDWTILLLQFAEWRVGHLYKRWYGGVIEGAPSAES